MHRRGFLQGGAALGVLAMSGSLWSQAVSSVRRAGGAGPEFGRRLGAVDARHLSLERPGHFGRLLGPDANGLALPDGFTSRVIARTGDVVGGSGHRWHPDCDGGATFATASGGWIYVSNCESGDGLGGAGAVRLSPAGDIESAYPILTGTSRNCAGGPTPWQTWLSCEESSRGEVWECDPWGERPAQRRPAMGRFTHEAAAVDQDRAVIYLTEDRPDGCFYRFRPDVWGSLEVGTLEVLCGRGERATHWAPVPDPLATTVSTRHQVSGALRFDGGEGAWYDAGTCWFTTKGDDRVWALDVTTLSLGVLYDAEAHATPSLTGVDNIVLAPGRRLFVAEDGGRMQICSVTMEGRASVFCRVTGQDASELAGVAFDPSGTRLYFSSQRGTDGRGITYEVSGPF
jgi:hypothetical protein